ncbi:hypothetical protein VSAK1_00500 [Vibrio mediterranei AK1]|uniref:helix-turn-helix domain-containing protein n=1 Tax=Vibrio mediterranei TaxID=689 RepID=UPI0001542565|nr:helix-turn-helix domain-containing protein [Vibrio mediterranei]EDL51098.1 hypothetical protein VSAK1_00500 [Vibrio mediterranei AK1]
MTQTNKTNTDSLLFFKYYREVAQTRHYNLKGKKQSIPHAIKNVYCTLRTRYEFWKSDGSLMFDNQDVLADMAGVSRTTFNENLKSLVEMGMVRMKYKKLTGFVSSAEYAWVCSPKEFKSLCEESVQLGAFDKQIKDTPNAVVNDMIDRSPDEDNDPFGDNLTGDVSVLVDDQEDDGTW